MQRTPGLKFFFPNIQTLSAKIIIGEKMPTQYFAIEVLPDPIPEVKSEEKPQQQAQAERYANLRNLTSNENAQEGEREQQQAQRAADALAEELAGDQQAIEGKLRANRTSYEQSLEEERAIREGKKNQSGDEQPKDVKVQGNVTVSFSFKNPVRHSNDLFIPAYMCRGNGTVVVNATLNRNGRVIAASVDKTRSNGDECMFDTALEAARSSYFNVDASAPNKHEGTITYKFVQQ